MQLNVVAIIGRLTQDAELRTTASGKSITNARIAYNRRGQAHYFTVVVVGKSADELASTAVGTRIAVEGRLAQDRWTDDDNNNRSTVVIVASKVSILRGVETADQDPGSTDEGDDDIPF